MISKLFLIPKIISMFRAHPKIIYPGGKNNDETKDELPQSDSLPIMPRDEIALAAVVISKIFKSEICFNFSKALGSF